MRERMLCAFNAQLKKDGLTLGVLCGQGSFASCFKVYERKTGALFGVAKISQFSNDDLLTPEALVIDKRHAILKESEILKLLSREPHVVALKRELKTFCVAGKEFGYFVMQPLSSLEQSDEFMSMWFNAYGMIPVLSCLAYSISSALNAAYTKNRWFSHRDVKKSNIFVDLTPGLYLTNRSFKLGDFGFCSTSSSAATYAVDAGNPQDPCRCAYDVEKTIESDIYSLAVVLSDYLDLDIPFSGVSGNRSPADYGEFGNFVQGMLSPNKQDRPSPQACVDRFGQFVSCYAEKIENEERALSAAIQNLNAEKTNFVMPQSEVQGRRLCGVRDWLRSDLASARVNFRYAGDTVSRFYLASMDANEKKLKEAQAQLLKLREELDGRRCHPVFDNVLALLYTTGYPLSHLEEATASAVLKRGRFSFY